jgi:hypothetical protein
MAILTKTKRPTLIRITDPVPTPDGVLPPGVYELVNGAIPAMLRDVAVPVGGLAPADVRTIDAAQFERDIERAQRLSATPAAAPELTRQQVCERFHWSAEDLVRAERLSFPRPNGQRIKSGKLVSLWVGRAVEEVEEWRADIAALARTIKT